ncbi:MAG: SPOR domain-containing protein [Acidobacteriota bacterium]
MQLTASEATCPLCKHPVNASTGHSDPTRLCEDCQRIVQTIRPTANAQVGVIDPPQAHATSQPHAAVGLQTVVPRSPLDLPDEIPQSFAPFVESSQAEFGEAADAEPPLLDFDELFEYEPFGNAAAHEAPALASEPFQDEDLSRGSTLITESIEVAAVQPSAALSAVYPVETLAVAEAMQDLSAEITGTEPPSVHRTVPLNGDDTFPDSFQNEVVTSPLIEPPQDLQNSPLPYPLVAGEPKRSSGSRLRLPLAAALVVCCGVAGYFLIYRPSIQASQSGTALVERPSGLAKPGPADQPAASQASTQTVAAKESTTPERAEQQPGQSVRTANEGFAGRYSLQAAAFPNDTGANEFCERLKRAGVPAYTVSAEIAGRGKWFRVRVGRFETAQDAERFASEARQRARASGLNLQLIVSSYETP